MKNSISFFLVSIFLFSCQPNKQDQPLGKPLSLQNRNIQKTKGTDCGKQPDSLRTDCAIIDFSVPEIQDGASLDALGKNLHTWVDKFLIHLLTWSDYPEADPSKLLTNLDAAIKRFHAIHDEAEGSVSSGQFVAKCTNRPLLNDGKYLTIQLDGHSFVGGNRPLREAAIATFDVPSGKQLTWDDLFKDKEALLPIVQAKVRTTRADAFREGFDFDKAEKFALPEFYGLVGDGILFHYQPDEIYRLGGATAFTIPFSELGNNLKAAIPVPLADNPQPSQEDDFGAFNYQEAGDSLVIPTFEIEVSQSAKARQLLTKQQETTIVAAYLSGDPRDDRDRDDIGMMPLADKQIELTDGNRIARFEGLKFSKKDYGKLADKDIHLLINVYSGRKSSGDNLLDCGLLDLQASQFMNKRFVLRCQLIAETPNGDTSLVNPFACYALPEEKAQTGQLPSLLVTCSENGEIEWAGRPVKDYDALMAAIRPVLVDWKKNGAKKLPDLETRGCMMGNSGEIRTRYDELKAKVMGKG